eukprot:snap_masked-scaffold_79-processed-gene-0.33-mRNA-1 protein AED:1.00 eAED:1.00 QI:0/0/0/0/1/1/2/0/123
MLKNIQLAQNIGTIILTFCFLFVSRIILGALLRDLTILAQGTSHYLQTRENYIGHNTTDSRSSNIYNFIQQTSRSRYSLTSWSLGGIITFFCVTLIPGAEYLNAYLGHFQLGIIFPILCIIIK